MDSLHYLWPIGGGLLIGTAAALYLLLNGRIAGISGLIANTVGLSSGSPRSVTACLLISLIVGAWIASQWLRVPTITITDSPLLLITAGILVGFGTRLGAGCTSGHGVCGMARLAPRSISATLIFMTVAVATVFVVRHLIGLEAAA